jgi:hypothetical protein
MNIDQTKETTENLQNCDHQWNFSIMPMKDSNLFTEKCLKCFAHIETFEILKK